MSFTTAQYHCITELEFVSADDIRNEVTFRSASHSQPGGFHETVLCVTTHETRCSCFGATRGEGCWHRTLAMAAYHALPDCRVAAAYTSDQLLTVGTKAARMVRVYRRRVWRVLLADQLAVVVCRHEWLRRKRMADATITPGEAA